MGVTVNSKTKILINVQLREEEKKRKEEKKKNKVNYFIIIY